MDEQSDDYQPTFRDYLAVVRKRWLLATITSAVVLVAGVVTAFVWPPVFRSGSTILIEQQAIPQDLVRSTISSFADQRIQLIKQRVMTTSKLIDVIREHELYAEDFDRKPREVIIERMRNNIRVDMISAQVVDPRSGTPMQATIAFNVSFDNRSPVVAARVANELTSLFLQESSQTRRQQAQEASTFLADESARLAKEIATLESRAAEFKTTNADRLPELASLNLQLLNRAQDELTDLRHQRSMLDERRVFLQTQLAQLSPERDSSSLNGQTVLSPRERLRALESYLSSVRGLYTPDHPDVVRTEKSIAALREQLGEQDDPRPDLERELAALKTERETLLGRYEPAHPDVVRLDRQIDAKQAELAAAELATESNAAEHENASPRADNPAYLQLETQIASDAGERRLLDTKEAELRKRMADLEDRLARTPGVERDFYALTRDLDSARRKHQEVSAKEMEAVVAQNLEMDGKSEHFTLIEPPLVPERPVAPNRWMIVALSVVLSLVVGAATIVVRELVDGSVRGPSELAHLIGGSPLGVIPLILTADDRRLRGRQRLRAATATAVTFIAFVLLMHFFVAPLDAIWFAALRRFGV